MTRVSKKLTQGLLRGLLLVSKLHFDTFLGLLALENGALACTRARIPTFKSGLKAFRKQPFWRLRARSRKNNGLQTKPVPHLIDEPCGHFCGAPWGWHVRCPHAQRRSKQAQCDVLHTSTHECHIWVLKCTHECHSGMLTWVSFHN